MARLLKGKQIENGTIDLIKLNASSPTDVLFTTGVMVGLTDAPSVGTDLANKDYVDSVAAGLDPKESVRVATTAALGSGTYSATGGTEGSGAFTSAPSTIDGVSLANGDRVLVKNQADAKQNGIYSVTDAGTGAWERATDQDGSPSNEVSSGNFTFTETGTTNATTGWVLQGDGILTLNTDDLDWVQFSESTQYTWGNGLINSSGNIIDVDADEVTITATGGTGNVQMEVLKVPNALTNGTGISTLSFDGSAAATVTIDNTGVAAGTYGSASATTVFGVNAQGQLTTATTTPIQITASQVSDFTTETTWAKVLTNGNTSSGNDALLSDGDVLKAVNGDSSLNLRAYGTDGNILLGNGPGDDNFANTAVYLSPTYGGLYWSDSAQTNSNYIQFNSDQGLFQATNNGVLNEVVLQNGGGTGSSFSENAVQITSFSGSITLSAGTENIFIMNDIPTDNSLTTVLARHPGLGGVLREVDVSGLTQDNFTTGTTLVGSDLYFDRTGTLSAYTVDLSPLLDDTNFYATGATLIGSTAYFDRTDSLSAFTLDLSALDVNDTFSTGTTNGVSATTSSNVQSVDITGNAGFADFTVSLTDTFLTGGTLNDADLNLTMNDGNVVTVDLSGLDVNDTFVTGGTVVGTTGLLRYTNNDATTFDVTGVTWDLTVAGGITADTTTVAIGDSVNIGFDASTLQKAVETKADKDQAPTGATTGNNFDTGITIAATPTNDCYVTVAVNGIGYIVGDATTGVTADCYFSVDGGTTARAIEDIVAGDTLFWNGTAVGFDLATDDNVDFKYEVLQS